MDFSEVVECHRKMPFYREDSRALEIAFRQMISV